MNLPAMAFHWSAPGSLLLFGEYFILLPGGRGLAVGGGPRATVAFDPNPSGRLEISVSTGAPDNSGGSGRSGTGPWTYRNVGEFLESGPSAAELSLIHACATELAAELAAGLAAARTSVAPGTPPTASLASLLNLTGTLVADSSDFFDGGRKLGFGSSAAVATALCACLLEASGGAPDRVDVFKAAFHGHRRFQGGKGSGYDVAASVHGGVGVFTAASAGKGAASPGWDPAPPSVLNIATNLRVYSGPAPQSTQSAAKAFLELREKNPAEIATLAARHAEALAIFLGEQSESTQLEAAASLRETALAVGAAIGCPADIPEPPEPRKFYKASGAGKELGFYLRAGSSGQEGAVSQSRPFKPGPGLSRESGA